LVVWEFFDGKKFWSLGFGRIKAMKKWSLVLVGFLQALWMGIDFFQIKEQ